jgi:hypothetical protein
MPTTAEVLIESVPKYRQIALEVAELRRNHSRETCAAMLGVNPETVYNADKS